MLGVKKKRENTSGTGTVLGIEGLIPKSPVIGIGFGKEKNGKGTSVMKINMERVISTVYHAQSALHNTAKAAQSIKLSPF